MDAEYLNYLKGLLEKANDNSKQNYNDTITSAKAQAAQNSDSSYEPTDEEKAAKDNFDDNTMNLATGTLAPAKAFSALKAGLERGALPTAEAIKTAVPVIGSTLGKEQAAVGASDLIAQAAQNAANKGITGVATAQDVAKSTALRNRAIDQATRSRDQIAQARMRALSKLRGE